MGVRAAPLGVRPLPLRGRQERGGGALSPASAPTRVIVAAYVICGGLAGARRRSSSPCTRARSRRPSHGNFYELYAIAAAVLGGCSLRGGEGSILGIVLGTDPAAGAAEPRQPARHPELAQLRGDGRGDPDRRARRPAILAHPVRRRGSRRLTAARRSLELGLNLRKLLSGRLCKPRTGTWFGERSIPIWR